MSLHYSSSIIREHGVDVALFTLDLMLQLKNSEKMDTALCDLLKVRLLKLFHPSLLFVGRQLRLLFHRMCVWFHFWLWP